MAARSSKKEIKKIPHTTHSTWGWSIALCLFAFILNLDTLRYEFTYDDPLVVSQNKFVDEGWAGIPKIFTTANLEGYNGQKESNYRPFSIAQFAIESSILGSEPGGFHFMHLLYYVLACLLVFRFLLLVFKKFPIWLPVAITALFIAHPLHTEVVANLKSRDEITALIGILLTLLLLLNTKSSGWKYSGLIFLTSGIAFFSKESALPLVIVAPLTVYFFRSESFKTQIKPLLAVILSAGLYLFMRQFIAEIPGPNFRLEDNALFAFSYPERYMAAIALIGHYAWLFLFPFKLRADYSFDQLHLTGWSDTWSYIGLIILGSGLFFIIKGFREKSISSYALSFSALFYIVTSNILVMTGATLAERFMFVPSLGLLILVGLVVNQFYEKKRINEQQVFILFGILIFLFSLRTFTRNPDWKDNPSIFTATVRDSPGSIRAQTKQARLNFEEAMRNNNPVAREKYFVTANTHLNTSMSIYPNYALTHFITGLIQKETKNYPAAISSIEKAISLKPEDGVFDFQLGLTYVLMGQDSLVEIQFQKAYDKGVRIMTLYDEWAKLNLRQKKYLQAIEQYKKYLEIEPDDRYVLSQITKIYRDQLLDMESAMRYNEQLKKLVEKKRSN